LQSEPDEERKIKKAQKKEKKKLKKKMRKEKKKLKKLAVKAPASIPQVNILLHILCIELYRSADVVLCKLS
jgi:hypothetical protein